MEIKDGFDSNYRYVLVAARRARQLQSGSQPLLTTRSAKACRVAQEELDAGLVGYQQPETAPAAGLPQNTFVR
jgi:DNA-directed RNA polymerase subunit omega